MAKQSQKLTVSFDEERINEDPQDVSRHSAQQSDTFDEEQPSTAVPLHKEKTTCKNFPGSPLSINTSPTLDTVASSDYDINSPRHQTVTIEHKVHKSGKGSNKVLRQFKKPVVMVLGALGLMASGGAAYFFKSFLEIPGLNAQIERLEAANTLLAAQVDELEYQIGMLANETDRLETEVDRLENTTALYETQNEMLAGNLTLYEEANMILNASLVEFELLSDNLNNTVLELEVQVDELEEQNQAYAELTETLNATVIELTDQVESLESLNSDLDTVNGELFEAVNQLSNETSLLSNLAESLNGTVGNLTGELAVLAEEIDRLEQLRANLVSIVSFLNETTDVIDNSFDDFAAYLASQTQSYRVLVLNTLENLYRQARTDWDCDFRSTFATEPFVSNRNLPIGNETYPEVRDYLQDRVLDPLCLNSTDLDFYFADTVVRSYPPVNITMNQMLRGISMYTSEALDFYFPEDNEIGLNPIQWADANYQCQGLKNSEKFRFRRTSEDTVKNERARRA